RYLDMGKAESGIFEIWVSPIPRARLDDLAPTSRRSVCRLHSVASPEAGAAAPGRGQGEGSLPDPAPPSLNLLSILLQADRQPSSQAVAALGRAKQQSPGAPQCKTPGRGATGRRPGIKVLVPHRRG